MEVTRKRKNRPTSRPGRPRAFDLDRALEAALKVFWRLGYEGASLPDLTKAMGINRPSMYAAFGNKEELFRKVVGRYSAGACEHVASALGRPTARKVAESLLRGTAEMLGDSKHPAGCLLVQGALACGADSNCVRNELAARRAAGEAAIRKRFERAVREGDLPRGATAADLARFITTMQHGMSVQATGGATRKQLLQVADLAMRAWPR
ncbi:MAG: TetR/AcrR family transcriptional regulator [Anaerolineae bacterium]|nr:TetR/AcrR family transcriptional regulator [Phycisphaerae bacterium]